MERERGYWPVKSTRYPWNSSTVFYWTGTVWQNSATNDKPKWPADAWEPIGPRLLEPSEIADVVGEIREYLEKAHADCEPLTLARISISMVQGLLDRLSPAMEIKVGKWYAGRTSDWFMYVLRECGDGRFHVLNCTNGGECLDCQKRSSDAFERPATAAEVAELRQIVPLGE